MRSLKGVLASTAVVAAASWAAAQAPSASPSAAATPRPPLATPPPPVEGWVVTMEIQAELPGLAKEETASPEAVALLGYFHTRSRLVSRFYLVQSIARQEIVGTDFTLPEGTVLLHKAGDRYYAVADPKAKTFVAMDADTLIRALEGGVGVQNTQYDAKVRHTTEKKVVAGLECRKSIATVTYVTSMPFENDRVLVQQKNEMEVWHTSQIAAPAVFEHLFLRFQQDRTGAIQKVFTAELGFPMEVHMTASLGAAVGGKAPKTPPAAIHMAVTEARKDKKLDVELFRIPPAGYQKTERLPVRK
jgi:hypothetical protein